jgi:integrase
MTVKVREWTKNNQAGSEVDIRFTYPDGFRFRRRVKAPVESKSAAKRWGEARERELLMQPSPVLLEQQEEKRKEVPTLREFGPRFIEGYARANRQKASGVATKECILKTHLYRLLGDKKLDAITDEDVQNVKADLATKSRKTVNNVMSVLNKLLKVAVKWKVIKEIPCSIELLKVSSPVPTFYEFDEYERLAEAAKTIDLSTLVVVLLGGDAGLRRGEMIGLRWCDVDFRRQQLVIEQSVWAGIADAPKSGHGRIIPMTDALATALRAHRHLRGERVLYTTDGEPVTAKILRTWIASAQRRAQLRVATGALHILRHTFCSHLAMRGAPAKAIQELAGHENLMTTLRYMHLSPSARVGAIKLLNQRPAAASEAQVFGDIVEMGPRHR